MTAILRDVAAELKRINRKWGEQNHLDGTGPQIAPLVEVQIRHQKSIAHQSAETLAAWFTENTDKRADLGWVTWRDILLEEVFEAIAEDDADKLRVELIQIAAVATQWSEAIDRRLSGEVLL